MVTCTAGSAVVINQKVFHGNFPNFSDSGRRLLAISYRPAWAGPVTKVAPWNPDMLATLPPAARRLFPGSQHPAHRCRRAEPAPRSGPQQHRNRPFPLERARLAVVCCACYGRTAHSRHHSAGYHSF